MSSGHLEALVERLGPTGSSILVAKRSVVLIATYSFSRCGGNGSIEFRDYSTSFCYQSVFLGSTYTCC